MTIGQTLGVLARARNLTQGNIAKEIGCSRISVNRFFKGHTELRATDFARILKVCGIDLETLITEELKGVIKQ